MASIDGTSYLFLGAPGISDQASMELDSRHTYTLSNWEILVAASTSSSHLRQILIDAVYHFYNTSSARVPATDWYETGLGTRVGFQARPVVGGFFALLARVKSGH